MRESVPQQKPVPVATSTDRDNGRRRPLRMVDLTENARTVLRKRYLRRGDDGQPVETIEEMFWRVAHHIALPDAAFAGDVERTAEQFYDLLTSLRFFPNSPTFTGAGTPLGQLAACFVLPLDDDMGRIESGIFQTLRDAALIQQTGGGNGFSFSRLRPKGDHVKTSGGSATGPVGFLRVYDKAFGEVAQGGSRRGANMGVLRVDHPDVEEFITCKTDENHITNFNISVGITDEFLRRCLEEDEREGQICFELADGRRTYYRPEDVVSLDGEDMTAVQALEACRRSVEGCRLWGDSITAARQAGEWELRFPDVTAPQYRHFHGTLAQAERAGMPLRTYKRMRARELFGQIVRQAHHNGEPGVLFLDAANRSNPVPQLYELESTNPCGEQFLGPFENCCLGSINLAQHVTPDGGVDWAKLEESVVLSTHFLDNVVDANSYVPSVPQLKDAAHRVRRIGLGIMGLSDLMYCLRVRYGSAEGQEFAAQIMEFVRYHCMRTSIRLAHERGPFPAIVGSIYDPDDFQWKIPQPLAPYEHDWGRPTLDWTGLERDLRRHGIRNGAQTTIAPTGTIATVAACEGYGCEPVFALAYVRHVNDNGRDLELKYMSPLFEQALVEAGVDADARTRIVDEVLAQGSCQSVGDVPEDVRRAFVVSGDITAEEHVRMQAALQRFVDNSISKTCNFPEDAAEEDVAKAYLLAWQLGCKGLTVYVTGSRERVVLETHATRAKRQAQQNGEAAAESETDPGFEPEELPTSKKPRPRMLPGKTFRAATPLGTAYITVNENGGGQPFEVFLNVGKAGSDTAAVAEAIGRLISLLLRLPSHQSALNRLRQVVYQLGGIGGGRSLGFGPQRVRSLPDGVAQAIAEYLGDREESGVTEASAPAAVQLSLQLGDLCPECGQASVVNEEGCRKCHTPGCGYSEC